MTSGGDRLDFPYDVISPAVSMTNAKIHTNSTISDAHKGSCYLVIDITNFYLSTNMPYHQYMHIHPSKTPQEIKINTNMSFQSTDPNTSRSAKVCTASRKPAYLLSTKPSNRWHHTGYKQMPHSTGLWQHHTLKTTFALCVDDFGVKYFSKTDAYHLINALQQN